MNNNGNLKNINPNDIYVFENLFKEFEDKIFNAAIFLTDSREEAEDILQETFIQAFTSLQNFKGQSSLYTWVYRIFLNVTNTQRRKNYLKKKFLSIIKPEEKITPIDKLSNEIDNDKFANELQNVLKSLKIKHKEVIVLRFFEDLKLIEIAERLDISIGTVKSRLHHALNKIKKSINNIEQFLNINN